MKSLHQGREGTSSVEYTYQKNYINKGHLEGSLDGIHFICLNIPSRPLVIMEYYRDT